MSLLAYSSVAERSALTRLAEVRFLLGLPLLLLVGCGERDLIVPEKPPEIVRVQVKVPVSLCPDGGSSCELLRDCYNEAPKEQTYGEAKRLANLRDASIKECNTRLRKIRSLQEQGVQP